MENKEKMMRNQRICLDDIKVKVHIPDSISESVRREKINLIYDILTQKSA